MSIQKNIAAGAVFLLGTSGWASNECQSKTESKLKSNIQIDVNIFLGKGIDKEFALKQVNFAKKYFLPYGVHLNSQDTTTSIPDDFLMGGDFRKLVKKVSQKGSEKSSDNEQLCQEATAPLKKFLQQQSIEHGVKSAATSQLEKPTNKKKTLPLNLVFLPQITAKGSLVEELIGKPRGITLSPQYIDVQLKRCLALPTDFTPTVLIGKNALNLLKKGEKDVSLVHEIGHTLGLRHSDRKNDLMNIVPPTCIPALSQDQLNTIEGSDNK